MNILDEASSDEAFDGIYINHRQSRKSSEGSVILRHFASRENLITSVTVFS